jgi:Cu/Ag efflux pump CusA
MLSSTLLTLVVIPAIYAIVKTRRRALNPSAGGLVAAE